MKATAWSYPSHFWETFCITALEAMVSNTIPVTTDLAALSTTVGEHGILLQGDSRSPQYQQEFVDKIVQVLSGDHSALKHDLKAIENRVREEYNWARVADEWEAHFEGSTAIHAKLALSHAL